MKDVGDKGDFNGAPGVAVALRQIKVGKAREDYTFKVDDTDLTRDSVTVGWSYQTQSSIQELSYVITGYVSD